MNRTTFSLNSTPHLPLVALEALGDAPPSRIRLLNWGVNESTKGIFVVGPVTAAALPANQKKYGFELIALDFQHNTLPGTPAFKESGEPRKIAAKGRPELVEGDGLFITGLQWTPDGLANWKNYIDVSAVPARDEQGNVTFLHSAAICRQGSVSGMELVAASVDLPASDASPADTHPAVIPLNAESMAAVIDAVGNQLRDAEWRKRELQELQDALARETQRNATLNTALEAVTAQLASMKAEMEALRAAAAPLATLTALSAEVGGLRTQVGSLAASATAADDRHERELLLLTARTQGKLIPLSAEGLASTPLATLRDLVANAEPGQVPMGRLTPLSVLEPGLSDQAVKRDAGRTMRRAQELSAQNPRWPWSRCWATAENAQTS